MTTKSVQKRNGRAQELRVFKANDDGEFYVESSKGQVCYKVRYENGKEDKYTCTCGNYSHNSKSNNYICKHILAIQNSDGYKEVEFLDKKKPKLDERFIKNIEGRDFVIYAGLLDLAHQNGLLDIKVEPLQFPNKENGNLAICKAIIECKNGTFMDVGDASYENCNKKVAKHLLRMASTRAKARALRDLTNVGMTCLEELGDIDEVIGDEDKIDKKKSIRKGTSTKKESQAKKEPATKTKTTPDNIKKEKPKVDNTTTKDNDSGKENEPKMSEAQKRAVYNLAKRRGLSDDELENMSINTFGVSVEKLSPKDASVFIRQLQQAA